MERGILNQRRDGGGKIGEEGGAMEEGMRVPALAVAAAAQGRRWQLKGSGNDARAAAIGTTATWLAGPRQGEASALAVSVAAARDRATAAAAAAEVAVGLFPRSSLSSHLRGSLLLSFFK